jgi:hypothetical protein
MQCRRPDVIKCAGLAHSPACGGVVGPWNGSSLAFGPVYDDVDATMDWIIRARLPAQLLRTVQHLRASQRAGEQGRLC